MQSPNATSATNSSIGYYLWLAAIGAIVYAYVFATSRAEMANTTLTPMMVDATYIVTDASGNPTLDEYNNQMLESGLKDINDPTTGKPMMNTGHRVITLLPFVWLYAVLTKAFTLLTIQNATDWFTFFNLFLTVGTLIGLVYASLGATVVEAKAAARANKIKELNEDIKTLNDEIKKLNDNIKNRTGNTDDNIKSKLEKIEELKTVLKNAENNVNDAEKDIGDNIKGSGSERIGWFTTNIVLLGIIGVCILLRIINSIKGSATISIGKNLFSGIISFFSNFVFKFWFPFMMMVYFIKTGATDWFRIVAVISIVLAIVYNMYNLFFNKEPMKEWWTTLWESVKYFMNTSPLLTYLKYVEGTELNEVAKRVLIFALLVYVAYLMNSVYKFKNRLVPCVSTSFASCFWNPDFKQGDYYDPSKTTPYVNALFYTLMMCMGVNILNFVLQIFSVYRRISEAFFLDKDSTKTWIERFRLEHIKPEPPSMWDNFSLVTFIQMIIFPFFWIFKLFAQHPIVTIIALVAFAALGLFLYRTSFDLTDFIEGQRGTVITVFTLFIASLVLFGAYIATNKPSSAASAASAKNAANNANNAVPSYAEFIGRPVMLMAVALCVIGIVTYLLTSQSRVTLMAGLLQYAITALIYIGAIAVLIGVARTVFSTSRKMGDPMFQISPDSNWVTNVVKLLGNALFYLPCLMLDTVDTLKEQYKLTSSTFLLILAAEAAFILAGLYLPALATKAINHTGVQIVSAPISMSHETTLSKYQIQFVKSNNTDFKEWTGKANPLQPFATTKINTNIDPTPSDPNSSIIQLHNYSYGVSAWVYIHPQPPNVYNNKTMNIFNFGTTNGPNVSYNPGTNTIIVSISMSDGSNVDVATITDIPLQRWNNIVVNSDKGAIDIFINGKLIYTGTHVPNIVSNPLGSIVVGQGKNDKNKEEVKVAEKGISGEICNMVLNREPFTSPEIAWFYKTNKSLNPPVVGANQDNQGEATKQETKQAVTDTAETPTPMSFSTYGARTYGIIGVVLGALFGWLFNDGNTNESVKGLCMGAIVFGLIGALLGALFSTDGTVAYVFKTVANVFVNTF